MTNTEIRSFRIDIPQAELDDLQARLARTRFAQELPDAGWDYGVPVGYLQRLVDRWRDGFDWRALEQRLNSYPQFTTEIDGQNVHFLHVRSSVGGAFPLILTHGWPGSVLEYLDVIEPLTQAGFDLVIPSTPGYGFSGPTTDKGWNTRRIAQAWAELMRRLGYARYGAVGNDQGSFISPELGRIDGEHVVGVHVTQIFSFPSGAPGEFDGMSDDEQAAMQHMQWFWENKGAYNKMHAQGPQTVAHALADSPAGLLGWNSQLFAEDVDDDFILGNVAIYWFTGTAASAMRLYYEQDKGDQAQVEPSDVPIGLGQFGQDFKSIRRFAERDHSNILSWNVYEEGGHYAAHQAPELFTADVQKFFAKVR
jgi:pimeloyl-ACP methyl ester carboxylesterase